MRIILLLVLLAAAAPGRAETVATCAGYIDTLPATICTGGTWCLDHDLATSMTSGNAITIAANNVTIDCNGFKIGNLAAGAGTDTTGILVDRLNTTVVGCHFRGFEAPIVGVGAHGARIEDNLFEGGHYYGLYLAGDGTSIRGNRFVDIGGANGGEAIRVAGRGEIRGNTIDGVAPQAGNTAGIVGYGDFLVIDNTIRGLVAPIAGNESGIAFSGEDSHVFIEHNHLQAETDVGSGVLCPGASIFRDNSVIGFEAPWTGCTDHGRNAKHAAQP